ncbi:sugar phosphate isomerase/epimerase [Natronolimnobius sp. AArcel1]|uniref:sugar phosphate isomerase/epimerase family protein n=1 Tax=Natronolimnobius sp. AArcel1 TaxID=1679093 RepID=UPI0013E9AB83|nr:sugar phosphate isomerase/epimerase [Natronolimnobius sp. AArcel1]NGM70634.1 sugar phosphate isomerase/epimerase [Natronolimnobius sp. AArcel1]
MNVGLCTISGGNRSVTAVMDAAADAGYDGVEIWGQDHVGNGEPSTCEEILGEAHNRSLEIPVYGSYLRPGTDAFADKYAHELDIARHLEADLIRVWAGNQEYQECTSNHWQAVIEDLVSLSDTAAEYGLGVTVEKHEGTVTNRHTGARQLIEAVDRDNCRLNYQPLFSLPNTDILSEARDLAPLSNNVHVQAVPERGGDERCLLENAYYNVDELLSIFAESGFDGYVNVEFVTENETYGDAVKRDLAFVRVCLE